MTASKDRKLVQEVAVRRKHERGAKPVGGRNDLVIANRSARSNDRRAPAGNRGFEPVGKWEEAVARAGRAFCSFTRAYGRNPHRAHTIRLARANAARRTMLRNHDAV